MAHDRRGETGRRLGPLTLETLHVRRRHGDRSRAGRHQIAQHVGNQFGAGLVDLADQIGTIIHRDHGPVIQRGMDVTFVRKLLQTIAFGGLAICLFLIPMVESAWAAIGILCLGKVFSAAGVGGFNVNHMDIGPKYAGSLMGITNTAGTIPGIVGVYISGLILEITGSWALVFQVTAGVTAFGMVFYLLFASGEKQFD